MNREDEKILIRFISPFETFFEGFAFSLSANDKNGPFDVLPGHNDFVGILTNGDVRIKSENGERSIGISKGIIHVYKNRVEVFANV
jgi:F-type H+-transporting ATPase subunit epsilon